jgi:ketosteroid isomerase-like protein
VRFVRVLLILQKDSDGQWKILRDIDNATPETF